MYYPEAIYLVVLEESEVIQLKPINDVIDSIDNIDNASSGLKDFAEEARVISN